MEKKPAADPTPASELRMQFSLKFLLIVTAVVSLLSALWLWFGVPTAMGFGLLTLAVFAHIAGNSIGTRLRDHGSKVSQPHAHEVHSPKRKLDDSAFAPATALRDKTGVDLTTFVFTAVGAAVGALLGAAVFLLAYWEYASLSNISAGVVAFAAMGGMGSFGALSFLRVIFGALSQATGGESAERVE